MRCYNQDRFIRYYSNMKTNVEKNEPVWSKVAGNVAINVVAYPFDYAKFLIQIGYEPIPPWPTTTLWGRPALGLPNIFQYIKFIKNVDGFYGCYRGLVPKLLSYCIYNIASNKSIKSIKSENEKDSNISIDDLEDEERTKEYIQNFLQNLFGRSIGMIVAHPFDVIWVRMMAQFVGRETKYVTIVGSIGEIYKTNGFSGFYAGFIPRFLAQTVTIAIISASTYYVNKYIIKDRELRAFTYTTMAFLVSTITYPFLLVAQCMAVNDCGLIAGKPPMMPIYADWKHCWKHLSSIKQLKRGSNVLWRTISIPKTEAINNNLRYRKLL